MPDVASASHGASAREALVEEMLDVLHAVARGVPDRSSAVRYIDARAALVVSSLRPLLPTWLLQCGSASKFHEFINLYAANLTPRLAFIDEAFEPCRTARPRRFDVFGAEA